MANEVDYVELGLSCADVCRALERGTNGKKLDGLSKSVCDAINQLTTSVEPAIRISSPAAYHTPDPRTVTEIQKVIKQSGRHRISRFVHARNDKDKIAAWKT